MRRFVAENLWWIVALVASLVLVLHLLSFLKVDAVALGLFLLILLSPFILTVKKIKFGDVEVEIQPQEIEKIQKKVEAALTGSPPGTQRQTNQNEQPPLIYRTIQHLSENVASDPVSALAWLRIYIERAVFRLRRYFQVDKQDDRRRPLRIEILGLKSRGILDSATVDSLLSVLDVCNRAVHGATIEAQDAVKVVELGGALLERLYWQAFNLAESHVEHIEIDRATLHDYQNAEYEVTMVIPTVPKPAKEIRVVTQDELDDILDGYNEYAAFVVEIKKIDKKLPSK